MTDYRTEAGSIQVDSKTSQSRQQGHTQRSYQKDSRKKLEVSNDKIWQFLSLNMVISNV